MQVDETPPKDFPEALLKLLREWERTGKDSLRAFLESQHPEPSGDDGPTE